MASSHLNTRLPVSLDRTPWSLFCMGRFRLEKVVRNSKHLPQHRQTLCYNKLKKSVTFVDHMSPLMLQNSCCRSDLIFRKNAFASIVSNRNRYHYLPWVKILILRAWNTLTNWWCLTGRQILILPLATSTRAWDYAPPPPTWLYSRAGAKLHLSSTRVHTIILKHQQANSHTHLHYNRPLWTMTKKIKLDKDHHSLT